MKKLLLIVSLFAGLAANAQQTQQQQRPRRQRWDEAPHLSLDSTTNNGYTLIFVNNDTTFQAEGAAIKTRMIETFYKVYPVLANTYNKDAAKRVVFYIDRNYNGVAATSGNVVRYKPGWMLKKPTDIDVVTHEVMHIVQAYGGGAGPGWLTEGIADYVRAVYGVDNEGAKWALPKYNNTRKYTDSYRVTAGFLIWVEKNVNKDLVVNLNERLRKHTFTNEAWKELTGKTLDELWAAYAAASA